MKEITSHFVESVQKENFQEKENTTIIIIEENSKRKRKAEEEEIENKIKFGWDPYYKKRRKREIQDYDLRKIFKLKRKIKNKNPKGTKKKIKNQRILGNHLKTHKTKIFQIEHHGKPAQITPVSQLLM